MCVCVYQSSNQISSFSVFVFLFILDESSHDRRMLPPTDSSHTSDHGAYGCAPDRRCVTNIPLQWVARDHWIFTDHSDLSGQSTSDLFAPLARRHSFTDRRIDDELLSIMDEDGCLEYSDRCLVRCFSNSLRLGSVVATMANYLFRLCNIWCSLLTFSLLCFAMDTTTFAFP